MTFSVDAFRAAHRPWSFAAGGVTWTARHVSTPQILAFNREYEAATTEVARAKSVARLLRIAFPWRLSYLRRGDPVKVLVALEPAARIEALNDFFECLAGKTPPPQEHLTTGTLSSRPNSTE